MSVPCTIGAPTDRTVTFGAIPMAIHEMWNGYSWPSATESLKDMKIKRITSSPYHPSANGQAESTNKVIIQNLKKRLEAAKYKWPEELSGVLWEYRTTAKSSPFSLVYVAEIPFSLVYVAEALISLEIREPTLRFFRTNEEVNNEALLVKLELLDERRQGLGTREDGGSEAKDGNILQPEGES
nr:uncharacterized protein LOC104094756 [Nicotiana tomentosiformis]